LGWILTFAAVGVAVSGLAAAGLLSICLMYRDDD